MARTTGFVLPALAIGLGQVYIKPQRGFYPKPNEIGSTPEIAQVTIEEIHHDEMEITDHPVERGAAIGDHAYKRPAEVVIRCAWSNSPSINPSGIIGAAVNAAIGVATALSPAAAVGGSILPTTNAVNSILSGDGVNQVNAIYAKLRALQAAAVLFDIYTGKCVYKDMLFKSITETTDKNTENSLMLTIVCRQILLTSTRIVTLSQVNPDAQLLKEQTSPTQNLGNQQLLNASTP